MAEHEINLPGNSHKEQEAKKAEAEKADKKLPVIAKGVARKRPLGSRFMSAITGDDVQGVGAYIVREVILPAIKSTVTDAVSQGIERMMFGDSGRNRAGNRRPQATGYTPYNRYSSPGRRDAPEPRRELGARARAIHDFDEIVLSTAGEADAVLDGLAIQMDKYGQVSVADLYEMVDITGSFTDNRWGWVDLRGATTQRVRDGWRLNLPAPVDLEP